MKSGWIADMLVFRTLDASARTWPGPAKEPHMLKIEVEREEDGRWIAEVPDLPGVLAYGATEEKAVAAAEALALRVLADRLEHGEPIPALGALFHAA